MYGNPGTGKTHIAIGLGIKACMEGFSVYFTTVPHLLTQIREAKTNKTQQSLEARFKKYDLVICDEMGYVGFETGGYLDKLETDFNIVRRVRPYLSGEQSRNVRYYLDDNFLSFWFRFIYKYRSAVEIGNIGYVREKIEKDYDTYSGFVLEKWFRQAYGETGEYNTVTNYWKKGSRGTRGEDQEIDLVAVNEEDKLIVIGEIKRNPGKIDTKVLQKKATGILSHHKGWSVRFAGLSLDDIF